MRYILLDRITSFVSGTSLSAIKAISSSEDFFQEHFPGNPVMPGALMIEAAAQAGTALFELSSNYTVKAFLIMVHEAKFRTLVRPGETLTFSLVVSETASDHGRVACEVTSTLPGAKQTRVATMDLTFGIRPVAEFYSEGAQMLVRAMYANLLRGLRSEGTS